MASNLYPGPCTRCGGTVPAQAGTRNKIDGRWTVAHLDGACDTADGPTVVAPTFAPTAEQQVCVDLYLTGESMVIEAGAGTGKTSTLRLLAAADPTKRVQYVAFNKAIAADVQGTMPANVKATNVHKLAFAAVGRPFAHRLNSPRMRAAEVAARLGVDRFACKVGETGKVLSEERCAGLVRRALRAFCQSADEKPARSHFPYVESIDMPRLDGTRTYRNNDRLRDHLFTALERLWADVTNPDGALPYEHDHYLKLWQLSHPVIAADVIMFDECQDANPVMAAVVAEQTDAQVVFVGDANQAIYEFTGAVNAIEEQKALGVATATLTRSFRFGPAIAHAANEILATIDGTDMVLVGHDPIASTVGALAEGQVPDAILCRTNAAAVNEVLKAMDAGQRPYLVGGGDEVVRFAKAARDLQEGRSTDHPDLVCFDSWGEVVSFVKLDADGEDLRLMVGLVDAYGVPTILRALDHMATEDSATVVVSTAHKAKGREWDTVLLAGDFLKPMVDGERPEPTVAELRLRYVAVTRAKLHLDHTSLSEPAADTTPDPEPPVRGIGDRWARAHGIAS